ncbi:hypothetical protein [Nocardia farcinica]|uniref:hypothetical protein n=2 Tax=Nocardia farcinica TaxID=37329 RepID=UPI000A3611F4|nr:hypothetical protein [Nocardia farcinica]MBF6072449.1 hypothetical protein [Nocardia farcinica]
MEMTVVAVGDPAAMRRAAERLTDTEWTAIVVEETVSASPAGIGLPSTAPHAEPEIVADLDLERTIADNPGGRVLVLCRPERARELVAQVLSVPAALVPAPEAASISRFRAARTGVRSVVSVNDTLHLTTVAAGAR